VYGDESADTTARPIESATYASASASTDLPADVIDDKPSEPLAAFARAGGAAPAAGGRRVGAHDGAE
jgi:hypothetical protein